MLGEVHSLTNDFPEYAAAIRNLTSTDQSFHSASKQYHTLDKKIRTLELNNVPTSDQKFTELKKQRVALKDVLYQRLAKNYCPI